MVFSSPFASQTMLAFPYLLGFMQVSGDSFYVNNEGPRTVLPSALSGGSRRSGGSTGLSTEEKMFDSSFKADPTLHESRRGKIL
mmetsp:Transcript_45826/g.71809  ORF Transcript_45826/g.71809 Transcript_45826/m.71809 type:complete len:84 (-) Transcript_45826:97-348(-)